ncbi:MAG: DUF998 domain-containing protein, partial [Bacteroidales bacterium]
MNTRKTVIIAGALSGIAAFFCDFLSMYILGSRYPGYKQSQGIISDLGASASPVSGAISNWWIIVGILLIIFAIGFRAACTPADRYARIAFWLIIIYALGEGLGSGLFKYNVIDNRKTTSYWIHEVVGGAGVFAVLVLPLAVKRIRQLSFPQWFRKCSGPVVISGGVLLLMFSPHFLGYNDNILVKYE